MACKALIGWMDLHRLDRLEGIDEVGQFGTCLGSWMVLAKLNRLGQVGWIRQSWGRLRHLDELGWVYPERNADTLHKP